MISNAASLSHSEPHKNIPEQNGGERETSVAKQQIRPGQSGDEGSTTMTGRRPAKQDAQTQTRTGQEDALRQENSSKTNGRSRRTPGQEEGH